MEFLLLVFSTFEPHNISVMVHICKVWTILYLMFFFFFFVEV